jgi:hypothetical protein
VCVGGGGGVPHVRKPPTTFHSGGTFDVALTTVYQGDQEVDYINIIVTLMRPRIVRWSTLSTHVHFHGDCNCALDLPVIKVIPFTLPNCRFR